MQSARWNGVVRSHVVDSGLGGVPDPWHGGAVTDLPRTIEIREVGPRDGLQSEDPVPPGERARFVDRLAVAGLREIEAASFVSPKAVPSMAGGADVMSAIDRTGGPRWWGLVPNLRGAEAALAAGVDALTVTVSACPIYNERNVRRTIAESVAGIADIVQLAEGRVVDVVISCVFGSPYTGDEPTATVPELLKQLADVGVDRHTLADTTGMATPSRVDRVLHRTGVDVGLHLHDTRGTALVNAWSSMRLGVTRFDTAAGGLGGSPFANGAGGNLATEDLVHLCDDAGIETGVDLEALVGVARSLETLIGRPVPGRIATHGPRSAA